MCQAREHKTNALIPVFLDSSQRVTQLTTPQAVGLKLSAGTTGKPSRSSLPLQSFCPAMMGPGVEGP